MASQQLLIAEPHPTVPAGSYTHSGRGGAGNTFRVSSTSTATASHPIRAPRPSTKFYSGIGGAGNAHDASERAALNFGEEFDRARLRDAAEKGHVGVGGAGNVYRKGSASSVSSAASEPRASHDTSNSTSGFWGRLSSSSFSRHH